MGPIEQSIREKLRAHLTVESLDLQNQSHLHEGHAGKPKGSETHFKLKLASPDFMGKSRMERHRLVLSILKEEMSGPVHALSLNLETPEKTT